MKKTAKKPKLKKDGTPKKITAPGSRGRAWRSKYEPHYDLIRESQAEGKTYSEIACVLGKVLSSSSASSIASFVRVRSDGSRPYRLPARSGTARPSVFSTTKQASAAAMLPIPQLIVPPANQGASATQEVAGQKPTEVKRFTFPHGKKLTVKTTNP